MAVVYAVDNNYVLAMAVSMVSLLENSNRDINYVFYVLTDSVLTEESQGLLGMIREHYENCKVQVIDMPESIFADVEIKGGYITKSTMYRLLIAGMLTDEQICVYLDADTLICGDLAGIADVADEKDFVICGVRDTEVQKNAAYIKGIGIPKTDTYVNAGVLVMNLDQIRKNNLTEVFLKNIGNNYYFNDQDILNKCCFGRIGILDAEYNFFSVNWQKDSAAKLVHFAGVPDVKPWNNLRCRSAQAWWDTASFFKETEIYNRAASAAEVYMRNKDWHDLFVRCMDAEKVYIWGYTLDSRRLCDALMLKGIRVECFIDNDQKKQGEVFGRVAVCGSNVLKEKKESVIINTVQWRRNEVNQALYDMGWTGKEVLQYYPKTKEYYRVLDEKYVKDEFYEFLDWQYDINNIT